MIGRIHAIFGREVIIIPNGHNTCFGCVKNCPEGRVLINAENRDNLPLSPGQLVETEDSPLDLIFQGFSALFPLCLGFLAGFFLVSGLFPSLGEETRAAGGVLGIFAGGGLTLLVRRRYPFHKKNRITRIISERDSGPPAIAGLR